MTEQPNNYSHAELGLNLDQIIADLKVNIGHLPEDPFMSHQDKCALVDQMSQFDLGQFFLKARGLDGYWTHHVLTYPEKSEPGQLHPLERYILEKSPWALATQRRYVIFKEILQQKLSDGASFASIPCGLMGDLLTLDYSKTKNVSLHGIDLDPQSLKHAKQLAEEKGLSNQAHFYEADAWNLGMNHQFDLIASNGLNIYVKDEDKLIALYRSFYEALKEDGILVTSFITHPPVDGQLSEWKMEHVNVQDALLQKVLLQEILDAKWISPLSTTQVMKQLQAAGFKEVDVRFDKAHIYPTFVALKNPSK